MLNLGIYTARNARHWSDRPAILFRDTVVTFRQLEDRSNQLAHALAGLGLTRGDRLAIVSPNRPEIVEIECALYKLGLVKVALNARLAAQELEDALGNAMPAAIFAAPSHRSLVEEASKRLPEMRHRIMFTGDDPPNGWQSYESMLDGASQAPICVPMQTDDLAVLHYTSGSTGKLKAAMQTVGNRYASLRKLVMGRMQAAPGDVLMLSGPITHASGMFVQPTLFQGATILLMERFAPAEILEAIERHHVTMCFFVPAMIHSLLADSGISTRDLSSLKLVSYGAAPMSATRIREAWAAFGPVLAQGYGAGETTGGVVALSIQDHSRAIEGDRPELLASCGRALGEADVQVLDPEGRPVEGDAIGEICVRGPDVFAGYWRAPEQSREVLSADGWLRTGDLARIDREGYLYIVDRKKEMLVSGGFNVYPSEVEAVLAQHPAVYEVCVIGIPDDHWGESVKAVVVPRAGAVVTGEELMAFSATRLADFKRPRSVDFVTQLPKNSNGKLSRKDVREPYWQGRARRVN